MRCAIRTSTLTSSSAMNRVVRALVGICAFSMVNAFAAKSPADQRDTEVQLNVLSRLEARTLQLATDVGVWVYLEGESFQGQSVQLEQKGLVIYEQKLVDGSFRIKGMPLLDETATLTVRLRSPNQADEVTELPLKPNQRRELFAKRPELLALAPTKINKDPLSVKLPSSKLEEDVEFDLDFLRGKAFRNLSPSEVKRLGSVRPGDVAADIYRNGNLMSKTTVRFTEPPDGGNARACITPALFQQLGVKTNFISPQGLQLIKTTASPADNSTTSAACLYIDQWLTGATSEFDINELRLDVSIPQAFLTRQNRQSVPPELLTRGENAGFINYNLNNYKAQGFSSNFLGLNTGINVGGWQVRHTSFLSQNRTTNGATTTSTNQYVAGETYAKRPLIDLKANLALGDVSSNSPIIGSTPIRGVRLSSEENMLPDDERSFRPVIKGVARTNARVRISQNNTVFFEQTVPPGPFEFDDINPISSVGNLTVVIAEADGTQQTFTVPYSAGMGKLNPGSYRYSIATGLYRNFTSTQDTAVVQGYLRYGFNDFTTPGMEVLLGPNYRNLGLQTSFNSKMGSLSFNTLFSHFDPTNTKPRSGYAFNTTYNPPAMGRFSAYAGVGRQSLRYTTPSTALTSGGKALFTDDSFKYSAYAGIGFGMESLGGIGLSTSQQTSWAGEGSRQLRLSYNVSMRQVFLGLNLDRTSYTENRPKAESISVSLSLPLSFGSNQGNANASFNKTEDFEPTQTLSYAGYSQENKFNYNLSQSQSGDFGSSSGSVGVQHRYGSLGASVSSSTGGSQQTSLSASGSMVLHSGGIILAPTVSETFAIVEVPKGEGAGVLGSAARINGSGFGVLPYLSPYYLNDVQISLEGAPTELEVDNANQKVAPVEGSIVRLKFNASTGRPLLIVLQASNGVRVPIGATVTDSQGNEVGTVGQGSRALVRVQTNKDRLTVVWGDKPNETCWVAYALDEKQTANASGFTNLKLTCAVAVGSEKTALSKE
jgi:outer membrane usher protein